MEKTHFRTCNLCEAMCGLEIKYEDKKIISIKGDKEDPFSKGFICPKAVALQDIYNDPDRLKKPIKKTANGWVEVSWHEAFDFVETNLKSAISKYGMDAVGIYQGNPNVHNLGAMLFASDFFKLIKTKNRFSATSVDQLPHHFVSQFMFGHSLMLPVPDINRTDYFLVIGANPIASNGSLMSAAGMPNRIKALHERKGKMVVIDPRYTETAQKADEHFYIQPSTDVYFLAAILRELIIRNGDKKLLPFMKNGEQLAALVERFTPEKAAELTKISAESIRKIANDFNESKTAVCYGRMGVSVQKNGTICQWLIYLINIVSGNFDKAGGHMFTLPAVDIVKTKPKGTMYSYNRWQSRVRGIPEFGNELPAAVMAEEMLTEGAGQIKAFLCNAGNPVLSTPNGNQLDTALSKMDFMVSFDIYLNETSRHAHIILPPATGIETSHYDLVFHNLAVQNSTKYSPALFEPETGMLKDWEIFKELANRFEKKGFFKKLFYKFLTPEAMINAGLKRGAYKIDLRKLKDNPHGIDLGPLKPCMPERLFTSDKKVDLAPTILANGLEKIEFDSPKQGMSLINRRHLRSNNSWMHNSERLVKGPERCTLLIHPDDASSKSIESGSLVKITNGERTIEVAAELDDNIMRGVVSLPHGWGHTKSNTKWKIAEAHAGVSVNDLTDDQQIDPISGNAAVFGLEVTLEKA
jgi:anaerobic selenocysteine-containing dehydrogenase